MNQKVKVGRKNLFLGAIPLIVLVSMTNIVKTFKLDL